jgi:hypothetical protein
MFDRPTNHEPGKSLQSLKMKKGPPCECNRPKSREETPKEGSDSLRLTLPICMSALHEFKVGVVRVLDCGGCRAADANRC